MQKWDMSLHHSGSFTKVILLGKPVFSPLSKSFSPENLPDVDSFFFFSQIQYNPLSNSVPLQPAKVLQGTLPPSPHSDKITSYDSSYEQMTLLFAARTIIQNKFLNTITHEHNVTPK